MLKRTKRCKFNQYEFAKKVIGNEIQFKEEENLEKKFIDKYKGFGVFAKKNLDAGSYLCEYRGKVLAEKAGENRLKKLGPSYLYFFHYNNEVHCIDGEEQGGIASFINDDVKRPTCVAKILTVGGKPHIGIFVRNEGEIRKGEEVTYSYGRDAEFMHWRENQPNPIPFSLDNHPLMGTTRNQEFEASAPSDNFEASDPSDNFEASAPSKHPEALGPSDHLEASDPSDNFEASAPSKHLEALGPSDHLEASDPSDNFEASDPSDNFEASAPSEHLEALGPSDHIEASDLSDNFEASAPSKHLEALGPSDHLEASDPSDNFEASDPSDNFEASAPSKHLEALGPSDHLEASDPSDNFEASDPSDNFEASAPSEHLEALGPSDHLEASDPSEHLEALGPSDHLEASDLSDNFEASAPSKHLEALGPSDHLEASDPSDNFEASDPSDNFEASAPSEHLEALGPSDHLEASVPSDNFEASDPSDNFEASDPSDNFEASAPSKHLEALGPSDHLEASDPSDNFEASDPSDNFEASAPSKHLEALGPSDHIEASDLSDNFEASDPSDNFEASAPSEHLEALGPSDHLEASDPSDNFEASASSHHPETSAPSDLLIVSSSDYLETLVNSFLDETSHSELEVSPPSVHLEASAPSVLLKTSAPSKLLKASGPLELVEALVPSKLAVSSLSDHIDSSAPSSHAEDSPLSDKFESPASSDLDASAPSDHPKALALSNLLTAITSSDHLGDALPSDHLNASISSDLKAAAPSGHVKASDPSDHLETSALLVQLKASVPPSYHAKALETRDHLQTPPLNHLLASLSSKNVETSLPFKNTESSSSFKHFKPLSMKKFEPSSSGTSSFSSHLDFSSSELQIQDPSDGHLLKNVPKLCGNFECSSDDDGNVILVPIENEGNASSVRIPIADELHNDNYRRVVDDTGNLLYVPKHLEIVSVSIEGRPQDVAASSPRKCCSENSMLSSILSRLSHVERKLDKVDRLEEGFLQLSSVSAQNQIMMQQLMQLNLKKTDDNQEKKMSGKNSKNIDCHRSCESVQVKREFPKDPIFPSDDVETADSKNIDCHRSCESVQVKREFPDDPIFPSDDVETAVIQNSSDGDHSREPVQMWEKSMNGSFSSSGELVEMPDLSILDSPRCDGNIENMSDGYAVKTEVEEQDVPSHSHDPKMARKFFKTPKVNQVSTVTTNTAKTNFEKYRQHRPCPFCFKHFKRFAAHLWSKHGNEKEIKKIRETRDKARRKHLFYLLRVEGLKIENEKRKGEKDLLRIKRCQVNRKKKGRLEYQCSNCMMIYSKNGISNHKRVCHPKENKPSRGRGVIHHLPFNGKMDEHLEFLDEEFLPKVVHPMHEGELKTEIVSDIELLYVGNYLYAKHLSGKEMRASETARKKLRYLTKIKIKFNNLPSNRSNSKLSLSEIFSTHHWYKLKKLLREMIYLNQEEKLVLKRGAANQIKYAIDQGVDALIGLYGFTSGEDATMVVQSLNKFKESYLKVRDSLFGKITIIDVERRAENRAVARLPSEKDITIVIQECNKILNNASMYKIFSESMFVEMRRAAVTRLILFNGRRPSEISLLKVRQWELAKNNCYLPSDQVNILKEKTNYNLLGDFKIIMTIGKRDDVPVVVPKLLFHILDVLSDPEIRFQAGVLTGTKSSNPYLFPSTRRSLNPCSGTDCVEKFLKSALPDSATKFTSVQVRHLLANKFAMEDYPEDVRKNVFRFFGHSELINELSYQIPNVRNVLKNIAPALSRIEAGFAGDDNVFSESSWTEQNDPDPWTEDNADTQLPSLNELQSDEQACEKKMTHNVYKKTPLKERSNTDRFLEGNSPGLLTSHHADVSSEEEEEPTPKASKRNYWPTDQNKILKQEFEDFICGSKEYPKKQRIQSFLLAYPDILPGCEDGLKEKKIRIKLNNAKRIRKQKNRAFEKLIDKF